MTAIATPIKTERPPDIIVNKEDIPAGFLLIIGKNLQNSLRPAKIPFGTAYERGNQAAKYAKTTIGALIREEDNEKWNEVCRKRDKRRASGKKGEVPQ